MGASLRQNARKLGLRVDKCIGYLNRAIYKKLCIHIDSYSHRIFLKRLLNAMVT